MSFPFPLVERRIRSVVLFLVDDLKHHIKLSDQTKDLLSEAFSSCKGTTIRYKYSHIYGCNIAHVRFKYE
jgi:hypothetical protein